MSAFTQTQTPSPETIPRGGFEVPDVVNLDTAVETLGEPYVAGERFHICDNIGGNMAVVYNAIDLDAESPSVEPDSVVKVLLHDDDDFPNRDNLGLIELSVMEALPAHPNIIRYLGQGSIAATASQDYRFIAMERANFGTLAHPREDLSDEQLVKALRDVAYGLSHLEEFNLVHCDIKPGNIGLHREEDGTIIAKILDFGSARPVNDDPSAFVPSHSEQFDTAVRELHIGRVLSRTPEYVSPEMESRQRITPAADIYSLGQSLARILELEEYVKNNPQDEDATIANATGQRVSSPNLRVLPDRVSPRIGMLLSRCLEREPEDRISSERIPELLAA